MYNNLKRILIFILLVLLWYWVCQLQLWSSYVLPSPQRVWSTFLVMANDGDLAEAICISARRVFLGFGLAFIVSFTISLIGVFIPCLRPYYIHFVDFIRHIPPLSLIPLLILWTGIGETPKIIVILLAAFSPLLLNIDAGLGGCSPQLLEVGKVLGFTQVQQFFRIMLPSSLPHIFVGLRISLGYSLRAIIGAEMVAASSGLGYLILDAQTMSRTDRAMVGIFCIGLLGLVLDFLMGKMIQHLFPYLQDIHHD